MVLASLPPAPVENGSTESDMAIEEETWEQREEPGGGGGGGGEEILASGSTGKEDAGKEDEEMMEEEEEEVSVPKAAAAPSDAPKKEHVNVVFIGHVGMSRLCENLWILIFQRIIINIFSNVHFLSMLDAGKSTIGGQIM